MKFLVDEMPTYGDECPFFKDTICSLDNKKCDYLSGEWTINMRNIYFHDGGICPYLKPLESEDTE